MLLETLRVKKKLKFGWPRAGLEIPSIFCSTHGPRSALVVVPALIVCHGQAKLILGRWKLTPIKCRAAESAIVTKNAMARRNTRATATAAAIHLIRGEMRRRSGTASCRRASGLAGAATTARAGLCGGGCRQA